ncbi:MAG TPA: hypothetical protein VH277_11820 [Gemmatimonadaceae bacterium]|jgi:hypothetical protein|nr:hypothetical protein [Gemmatimonadaceae bacterium]
MRVRRGIAFLAIVAHGPPLDAQASDSTAWVTRGELLAVGAGAAAAEGVDSAFVYTFARYDLLHRRQPELDLDRVSAGVVKVLDGQAGAREGPYRDMPW